MANPVEGHVDGVRWWRERLPFLVLLAYLAVALPLLLFRIGRFRWFYSDEWGMLTETGDGLGTLLEPNNAHWSTLPTISYRILWSLFGLHSYLPYQAVLLCAHAAVVVLLWFVLRRCRVDPWLSTAVAAVLVLFGPGADDIVWAFQIGFVGALAFGLGHILLVVDDPSKVGRRRDALGLAAGLCALMSSGVGVVMVAAVAGATLLRRGWRAALLHGGVLGAVYLAYVVLADPQSESPAGRPGLGDLVDWFRNNVAAIFGGIGGGGPLVVVLVAVVLVGLGLVLASRSWPDIVSRLAIPVALAGAALAFAGTTALGRWHLGDQAARSSRYVYIGAALVLPLIGVALDAVRRRWPVLLVPLVVLVLVPLPSNARSFEGEVYDEAYFDNHERIIYAVPELPFVDQVSRDARPIMNPFIPPEVNVGFLLDAAADGKMPDVWVSPAVREELRVRLGLEQGGTPTYLGDCQTYDRPIRVVARKGDRFALRSRVSITSPAGQEVGAVPVEFQPFLGPQLIVDVERIELIVGRAFREPSFVWCEPQ